MIRPSDPSTEGGASPDGEVPVPQIQPIESFDDLPPESKKNLAAYTEAVGEMLAERMKQKACEEAGGIELYLACVVEQLAYILMTQQSQNLFLLKVSKHLDQQAKQV